MTHRATFIDTIASALGRTPPEPAASHPNDTERTVSMTNEQVLADQVALIRQKLAETHANERRQLAEFARWIAATDEQLLGELRLVMAHHEEARTRFANELTHFADRYGLLPTRQPRPINEQSAVQHV